MSALSSRAPIFPWGGTSPQFSKDGDVPLPPPKKKAASEFIPSFIRNSVDQRV